MTLLERLRTPDAVKAVRMDMRASYRPAVQLCLPHAHIVVDHFHVIQPVMKGFKKVLQSWAHKKEGNRCWKANRFCFCGHMKTSQKSRHKIAPALANSFPSWRWHGSSQKSYGPGMNVYGHHCRNAPGCLDCESPNAWA